MTELSSVSTLSTWELSSHGGRLVINTRTASMYLKTNVFALQFYIGLVCLCLLSSLFQISVTCVGVSMCKRKILCVGYANALLDHYYLSYY